MVNARPRDGEPEGRPDASLATGASRGVVPALYLAAAILGILFLRIVHLSPFDHDEVEHFHASWRLLQGDRPYADFHQNHTPAVWLLGSAILQVLPQTADALLALRWLSAITFLAALAASRRLFDRLFPNPVPVLYPLALIASLCLALRYDWYRFRPDPFASLLVTVALVVAARRELSLRQAALAGSLLGLAASFSPKMWPLLALLPLRFAWAGWRSRSLRPLAMPLLAYGLGGVAAVLPTIAWLVARDVWQPFIVDVIEFNMAYTKPLTRRLSMRALELVIVASAAVTAWFAYTRKRLAPLPAAALAASVVQGLSINAFTWHSGLYNLQSITIPAGITLAFAATTILGRRASGARLLLVMLFLGVSLHRELNDLVRGREASGWAIPQSEFASLTRLAASKAGARCAGFAPCHPVFCESVGDLALGWDTYFLDHPDPVFQARHERLWIESLAEIRQVRPEFVMGQCDHRDPWQLAIKTGELEPAVVRRTLDELRRHYEARWIGSTLVWIARPG